MIRTAVLAFSPTATSMHRRVAGLSLFERGVRSLARTGVERILILTGGGESPTLSRLAQKLDVDVEIVPDAAAAAVADPGSGERYLLVLGEYVHHHESLTRFANSAARGSGLLAQVSPPPQGNLTPPALPAGALSGAFATDAALLPFADLAAAAADGQDLTAFLVARADSTPDGWEDDRTLWRRVVDRKSARAAKNMLFSQVTKKTSGPISRHINARVSIPTSKLLIETGISPHMITVLLVLTTGLAAAYLVSQSGPGADGHRVLALAGLLWQFAAIFDRCDGEIARVKLCESKFGEWFDTLTDNIAYLCLYAGMVAGMSKRFPEAPAVTYLGISGVAALILTLAIMYVHAVKTGSGSLQNYLVGFRKVPDSHKGLIDRLLQRYGFMAQRDFWSFIVFILTLMNLLEVAYAYVVVGLHLLAGGVLISGQKMLRLHRSGALSPAAVPTIESKPKLEEDR